MAKTQFNKMNKDSREALAKFDYAFKEAEAKKRGFTAKIATRQACLDTDIADLDALRAGKSGILRSEKAILESIASHEAIIADLEAVKSAFIKVETAVMKKAFDLIPEGLYEAYCKREESDSAYEAYRAAFTALGVSLDVTLTDSTVRVLMLTVGDREVRGKKLRDNLTSCGIGNATEKQFNRLILHQICKLAGIHEYKWDEDVDAIIDAAHK